MRLIKRLFKSTAISGYKAKNKRKSKIIATKFEKRAIIKLAVQLYRLLISPVLPASCRFYPSCSQYALQALRQHNLIKSCWLICCRLLRCHPWANGGYDPVPIKENI